MHTTLPYFKKYANFNLPLATSVRVNGVKTNAREPRCRRSVVTYFLPSRVLERNRDKRMNERTPVDEDARRHQRFALKTRSRGDRSSVFLFTITQCFIREFYAMISACAVKHVRWEKSRRPFGCLFESVALMTPEVQVRNTIVTPWSSSPSTPSSSSANCENDLANYRDNRATLRSETGVKTRVRRTRCRQAYSVIFFFFNACVIRFITHAF